MLQPITEMCEPCILTDKTTKSTGEHRYQLTLNGQRRVSAIFVV